MSFHKNYATSSVINYEPILVTGQIYTLFRYCVSALLGWTRHKTLSFRLCAARSADPFDRIFAFNLSARNETPFHLLPAYCSHTVRSKKYTVNFPIRGTGSTSAVSAWGGTSSSNFWGSRYDEVHVCPCVSFLLRYLYLRYLRFPPSYGQWTFRSRRLCLHDLKVSIIFSNVVFHWSCQVLGTFE